MKWIIRSNNIQYFPVDTEYMENAKTIGEEKVFHLKLGTTRKNLIQVTEYLIRVPKFLFKNLQRFIPEYGYIF